MFSRLAWMLLSFAAARTEFPAHRRCHNTHFECDNGACIDKKNWCSRYRGIECRDGSNRRGCSQAPYSCAEDQAFCLNNGKCIPLKWTCDGYDDCTDGSDESECLRQGYRIRDIPGVEKGRSRARLWIEKLRRTNWGWERGTNRALVALHLSNPQQFNFGELPGELMVKQLQLQLAEELLRNGNFSIPSHELALYVHSFLAACLNPRDFYGYDLINDLNDRATAEKSLNPFVALVLCNSNATLSSNSIGQLIDIMLQPTQPEWIDLQAYSAMTLACLRNRNKFFLEIISTEMYGSNRTDFAVYQNITDGTEMFKNLQNKDGSFGSTYTTALVAQALLASNDYGDSWDLVMAFRYILSEEKPKISFGDMMTNYLVLPLLNGKTLADLGTVECSSSQSAIRNVTAKDEFELKRQKHHVTYSIWLGETKDVSFQMSMNVPINATFYDVMRLAAELDIKYRFEYVQYPSGRYISSIFDVSNDPEARKYWQLYRLQEGEPVFHYKYPDKMTPKSDESFVYWYKMVNYNYSSTT